MLTEQMKPRSRRGDMRSSRRTAEKLRRMWQRKLAKFSHQSEDKKCYRVFFFFPPSVKADKPKEAK